MERYIYYLTQRPAGPGCLPIKGLREITDQYDERTYDARVGRPVWARADYCRRLTASEVADYELLYSPLESSAHQI